MKSLILALALLASTPAVAQVRPSVEVTASGRSFENITPGLKAGLGFENLSVQLGAEREGGQTIGSAVIEPSLNLTSSTRLYGEAGAVLVGDNLGYRLGAGIKQDLRDNTYLRLGAQRDDFGNGANGVRGTVGFGVRF